MLYLEYIKNEDGSSLVELIMVMMLLLVFGFTIFTLINTGASTQEKIIENKDAQVDARIAINYINVILRKNDSLNKISVETVDSTGKEGILISENTQDGAFDTWIYFSNGQILECMVFPGEQPDDLNGFVIIDIDDFSIEKDEVNNTIITKYEYDYNDEKQSISNLYKMRHDEREFSNNDSENEIIVLD